MKKPVLSREVFAAAALRCFERYGPQRTSMADIAEEAGASRQSIYRLFADRSELVQFILDQRMTALAKRLAKEFKRFRTLEEALVEGSLLSLEVAASDPTMSTIMRHVTDESIEHFLISGSKAVHAEMDRYWAPLIEEARQVGQISATLANDKIMTWIRHIHFVIMRDELSDAQRRDMLETFFVPSILQRRGAEPDAESPQQAAKVPEPANNGAVRRRAKAS